MESLKKLLVAVSPEVVVSIRGRHAVGKSEAVAQFANELGLPLQMRRLSQMTEGDLLGMPRLTDKGTTFMPCEWFLQACEKPMVLFLDERNRALDAVKQSIFEICDSRQFYGHRLHPQTRVVIAENVGDAYQVQACDPAEVSRTVTVELEPSMAEWLAYAKGKCHEATVEFIRTEGEKVLEFKGANGVFEPNKKYPDRRSWFKLDHELSRNGLFETPEEPLFFVMAAGFIGTEVAQKFTNFCKNRDKNVSVKDVLSGWEKARNRLSNGGKKEIANEKYIEIVEKFKDFFSKEKSTMDDKQVENFRAFLTDCPPEARMSCYSAVASNREILKKIHSKIGSLIVATASGETPEQVEARKKATQAAKISAPKK